MVMPMSLKSAKTLPDNAAVEPTTTRAARVTRVAFFLSQPLVPTKNATGTS